MGKLSILEELTKLGSDPKIADEAARLVKLTEAERAVALARHEASRQLSKEAIMPADPEYVKQMEELNRKARGPVTEEGLRKSKMWEDGLPTEDLDLNKVALAGLGAGATGAVISEGYRTKPGTWEETAVKIRDAFQPKQSDDPIMKGSKAVARELGDVALKGAEAISPVAEWLEQNVDNPVRNKLGELAGFTQEDIDKMKKDDVLGVTDVSGYMPVGKLGMAGKSFRKIIKGIK